jgi:hypothetical protein
MGFTKPTETRFPSQGIASPGGFFPPIFAALCFQFPPPDSPELPPPSVFGQFVAVFLALLLLVVLVLLVLPEKWRSRVAEIAFCKGRK